jgi:repressor LexA
MLTKKQYELLVFVERRLRDSGVSPSFDEMKEALGLRSKSGIHRLISGLEERGFIRRLPHRARALEVLRLPENHPEEKAAPPPAPATIERFRPNVIRGDFQMHGTTAKISEAEAVELPLYGRIAAGTPVEALRDPSSTVGCPAAC